MLIGVNSGSHICTTTVQMLDSLLCCSAHSSFRNLNAVFEVGFSGYHLILDCAFDIFGFREHITVREPGYGDLFVDLSLF